MAAVYEIPLSAGMNQRFRVTLVATEYLFELVYCDAAEAGWTLSILDADETAIVAGIPLVTGGDLLAAYPHLGIGGKLFVATDGDADAAPTWGNLGTISHLYWVPN